MRIVFKDITYLFSICFTEGFLPIYYFAKMVVWEEADGREIKIVFGDTAWQTERWAPQVINTKVLLSSGNLAQRTGPCLE